MNTIALTHTETFFLTPLAIAILAGWLATLIIGTWIGSQRGRAGIGFLVSLLFGPLGIIIACLLPAGAHAPKKKGTFSDDLHTHQLMLQYRREEAARLAAATAAAEAPTIPLRIRRGHEEIGAWPVPEIRHYLRHQNLTIEDEYYDPQDRTWLPLASLPWS